MNIDNHVMPHFHLIHLFYSIPLFLGFYTVYKRDAINYFWSIKNSNEVLNKFKSKNFQASNLSTYIFSILYTTFPHHLIKDKLIDLINRTFIRENTQYLACNEDWAYFTSDVYNIHKLWSCQKMPLFIFGLIFLLDLELNFTGKLLVFRWELIVLLLLQNCLFFVMREISWSLSHVKARLTLLRLSIRLQDTLMIY